MSASRPGGSKGSADDGPWTPEQSRGRRNLSDSVQEISTGVKEIRGGASKAIHGLVLLIVLLIGLVKDRDEARDRARRHAVSPVDPDDEFWTAEPLQTNGPSDVSENVDEYLYSSAGDTDE